MGKQRPKTSDLLAFAKKQARLSFLDYGGQENYRQDRNNILRAKRAAKKAAGMYWFLDDKDLKPGSYFGGRLVITKKSIEYIPGQYAPTEIYHAVEDYFIKLRT